MKKNFFWSAQLRRKQQLRGNVCVCVCIAKDGMSFSAVSWDREDA